MLFTETLSGGTPMKRMYIAAPSLAVLLMVGCGGPNRNDAGAGSESGAMPGGTGQMDTTSMPADSGTMETDTGMSSPGTTDTSAGQSDTASTGSKANQTKSGVTDTRTGKSTLGTGATKTRPDQGQPVTSKGDTIDSSAQANPTSDTSATR